VVAIQDHTDRVIAAHPGQLQAFRDHQRHMGKEERPMPVLPIGDQSVDQAMDALRAGSPIVIPMPSPMAYTITGTGAAAVNAAKGRPAGQPTGLSVTGIDVVAPYLDIAQGVLPMARWLGESEMVSLLAPARPGDPGWLSPAISGGMLFFASMPWLAGIDKIIAEFGHLYMSSANRTGGHPAITAAEAQEALGGQLLVLDGDPQRDASRPHGSTTMVRISSNGDLAVARSGINNLPFGDDLAGYAADLATRWRARHDRP
jgi:L-threonylcarbamoyladenylate synthase